LLGRRWWVRAFRGTGGARLAGLRAAVIAAVAGKGWLEVGRPAVDGQPVAAGSVWSLANAATSSAAQGQVS
jgi:hypothetical protein